MYFKIKGDPLPQLDRTFVVNGEWYDSEEEANDEDARPWLLDQIRVPVVSLEHVTAELLEDLIVERAEEHEVTRAPAALPTALEGTFGRGKTVNVEAVRLRVKKRRDEKRGRS